MVQGIRFCFSGLSTKEKEIKKSRYKRLFNYYSTVTLLAKLRGWSTLHPLITAI